MNAIRTGKPFFLLYLFALIRCFIMLSRRGVYDICIFFLFLFGRRWIFQHWNWYRTVFKVSVKIVFILNVFFLFHSKERLIILANLSNVRSNSSTYSLKLVWVWDAFFRRFSMSLILSCNLWLSDINFRWSPSSSRLPLRSTIASQRTATIRLYTMNPDTNTNIIIGIFAQGTSLLSSLVLFLKRGNVDF